MIPEYACTVIKSLPRRGLSRGVPLSLVLRRLFVASSAGLIVFAGSGCQKPKGVDLIHQGMLVGRVIDAASRSPIAGAILSDTPAHTSVSDAQGAFQLPLPDGEGTLLVSAPGYRPVRIQITVEPGKTTYPTSDGYISLTPLTP